MHKIQALHNKTGQWVELADDISNEDYDEARGQIMQPTQGCASVITIWGVTVKISDFSAYRVN